MEPLSHDSEGADRPSAREAAEGPIPGAPGTPAASAPGLSGAESPETLRQYLAAIVESSADAILSQNLDGVVTSWNQGAEKIFGYAAEEIVGRSVTILIPSDRQDEETSMLARLQRGERIEHFETIRRRKDGSLLDISLSVSPIRDASGRVVGASKIARDITDRRAAADQTKLLLLEMQHRARNLATVIEALARQSKPDGEPAVDAFVDNFLGRVRALLATGELVVASSARHADLRQVFERVLRPFIHSLDASPFSLEGPPLRVAEQTAGGLALAVHELATNALKYGSLRSESGRVWIRWTVQSEGDGKKVRIEWKETGGIPIAGAPTRSGFGSRMIGGAVSRERHGGTQLLFEPDGLRCCFEFSPRD